MKFAEAPHAVEGIAHDEQRPPVTDGIERAGDKAVGALMARPFHHAIGPVSCLWLQDKTFLSNRQWFQLETEAESVMNLQLQKVDLQPPEGAEGTKRGCRG
ncbi:hypothetical protein ACVDG8_033075 [Mesorhizobium sp. ORM8.1]